MTLQPEDVIALLERLQLIRRSEVLDPEFSIVDVSRRNHNFKVTSVAGKGYFVKQAFTVERANTIRNEATTHQFLELLSSSGSSSARFGTLAPRCIAYLEQESILINELVPTARSVSDLVSDGKIWRRLARAL